MKRNSWLIFFLLPLQLFAQDSTINNLMKGMDESANGKKPVKIFNSERAINANTTEMIGKGKMDFKITHNFGDLAGDGGGVKTFFGLDAIADVRIGFHLGLTDRLNVNIARVKGDGQYLRQYKSFSLAPREYPIGKFYEIALKYQLLRQLKNDPTHPVSVAVFINTAISTMKKADTSLLNRDTPSSFKNFGDRMSEVFQVIIAKKIGKASVQLHPTLVHYNYVPTYDDATTFALGGAVRVPLSKNFAIIVDYFHSFLSDTKKNYYYASRDVKFHDALGVGLEITTAGHIFHMNFTNTSGILENQFIPYNSNSWGKGQFRWGFTISRKFALWREKK